MKKSKRKYGEEWEKKVQKTLNSGTFWFDKCDLKSDDYAFECKCTEKKSYSITAKLLEKLWGDALDANKLPILNISLQGESCRWMLTVKIERE